MHTDNKNKGKLVLGETLTERLHGATISVEAKYHFHFPNSQESLV